MPWRVAATGITGSEDSYVVNIPFLVWRSRAQPDWEGHPSTVRGQAPTRQSRFRKSASCLSRRETQGMLTGFAVQGMRIYDFRG